jgi:hypothetical protein
MPSETMHATRSPEQPASDGVQVSWYAAHSWRAWLMTGARKAPIDRRRLRGSDAHLKRVLMGGPSGAVDFPSAMARQAIDEAMNRLPPQHKQVVKLAYFGGLTNREIALQLGLTLGGVRRRLRESLATVTAYVERGRTVARRAVHGLVLWLYVRRFGAGTQRPHGPFLNHIQQVGMVAVVTAAAAAVLVTHQASPGDVPRLHKAPSSAAVARSQLLPARDQTVARTPAKSALVAGALPQVGSLTAPSVTVQVPATLPNNLQIPLRLPINVHVSVRLPIRLPALPVHLRAHLPALLTDISPTLKRVSSLL